MNILQPPTKARKFQEVAQYLQDIGLSASSATVRECVTELERKDAEIARLKDELARSSHLEATSDEWHGMWDVANERANKAEADLAALRAAVLGLPVIQRAPFDTPPGVDLLVILAGDATAANAARAAARKLAGEG